MGKIIAPKHVELNGITNKPLLLHLVGCLYYLYQWFTVKQISNLWFFFTSLTRVTTCEFTAVADNALYSTNHSQIHPIYQLTNQFFFNTMSTAKFDTHPSTRGTSLSMERTAER